MGVDITVGERMPQPVAVMYSTIEDGGQDVRQEARAEAPLIYSATVKGPQQGRFNFTSASYGYWGRILDETGIDKQFPELNFTIQPVTIPVPPGLGAALHRLATEIELGIVKTKAPAEDAAFICWLAWWCQAAPRLYGDRAAIHFG